MDRQVALGRAEIAGAGAWPNPSLAWDREGSAQSAGGTQDIVYASIPLVLSGRLGQEEEAALERARAAEARAERGRALLRYRAVQAYTSVLAARQRIAVLQASLAKLHELEQAVSAREHAGAASGYDRLRIEVERATATTELQGARAEEKQAVAAALSLLGPDQKALPPFPGPLAIDRPLPRLPVLLQALGDKRADLRALSLEARAAEAARRAAARRWLPEPTLKAGVQLLALGGSDLEPGYVVGVTLPLPLFDHGQGEQARAAAARDLARSERAALLASARARLIAAFDGVAARREQLAQHRSEVVAKTQELRGIAGAAYRGGAAELLVLVDAERAARSALVTEIALVKALVDAETELLLLAGAYDGPPQKRATR